MCEVLNKGLFLKKIGKQKTVLDVPLPCPLSNKEKKKLPNKKKTLKKSEFKEHINEKQSKKKKINAGPE